MSKTHKNPSRLKEAEKTQYQLSEDGWGEVQKRNQVPATGIQEVSKADWGPMKWPRRKGAKGKHDA